MPGDSSFDGILGRSTSLSQPVTLALAVDSAGHPFVAWGDSSSGSSQIYTLSDTLDAHKIIYVNDSPTVTDFYTTAGGSNANSGLTPALPLASIQAALSLVSEPGDVILVDGGSYNGFTLTAAANGVLILGSPTSEALITGTLAISNADNATLESLKSPGGVSITGGSGIDLLDDIGGTITIGGSSNGLLLNDAVAGLTLAAGTTNLSVIDSQILGGGIHVSASASGLLISDSTLASLVLGATSQGTISHNNIDGGGLTIDAAFTGSIDHNLDHARAHRCCVASTPSTRRSTPTKSSRTTPPASSMSLDNSTTPAWEFRRRLAPQRHHRQRHRRPPSPGQMQDQSIIANNDTGVTGSGVLGGSTLALANQIQGNTSGVNFTGAAIQYNRHRLQRDTSIVVRTGSPSPTT